ncbi:MAG: DUF1080 domain-containing protein [Novosphingobium sp.]
MIGGLGIICGAALAPQPLLSAPASVLPRPAWRPLFNGRNLDGWSIFEQGVGNSDPHGAIAVKQGMLHLLGPGFSGPDASSFGHIATIGEYANFHLRMEFRFGERRFAPRLLQRRNSGLLYHMASDRDRLFPDCVEFQFEEGDIGDAIMVNTRSLQGPQLGGTPLWPNYFPGLPTEYAQPTTGGGIARQWHRHSGAYERLDSWNTIDLYAFGDQAAHLVNGRIVNTLFRMVGRDGAPLTRGRIALEFEAAEVFMRNVMIRDLLPQEIAEIRSGR